MKRLMALFIILTFGVGIAEINILGIAAGK